MKKKIDHNNISDRNVFQNTLIEHFVQYMNDEIGLKSSTIQQYSNYVRYFLQWRFKAKTPKLNKITSKDIYDFIILYAHKKCSKTIGNLATSLRSFFEFNYRNGLINLNLATSVPAVGIWGQTNVPEYLSEDEVKKLLLSCDQMTLIGLRDFAILMLLTRLGLRASEVVNLTLDDFDWQSGEVMIKGKGSSIRKLPILKDVGEALIAYLMERPHCTCRSVFICATPPLRGLKGPSTVSTIVGAALRRSGIHTKKKGAHLLRHTFATILLRHGCSLHEIGQVLGHHSINTTAIYAKVDFQKLSLVAIPWPLDLKNGGLL